MARVYIETTIPSFYFETRTSPLAVAWRETTRNWWDHHRHKYELCTSRFVLGELRRTPGIKVSRALALLTGVSLIDELPGTLAVADHYIEQKLMPADAYGDAAHLAMASMHGIDFLVTWNCKHLANANKAAHIRVVNTRLGLPVPLLVTPLELLGDPAP